MTLPRPFLCALLLFAPLSGASATESPPGTALTIERLFAAPDLSGPTLRGARLSPDARRVLYLKAKDDAIDVYDLWAYDIGTRRHARLVDADDLETSDAALSADEAARRERQRTSSLGGIVEFEVAADGRRILLPVGGDLYLYDLRQPPASAVTRLTRTDSYETDARLSPRGRYASFIRDANLVVIDLATRREVPITREGGGAISYGVAEFIAQEEMGRSTGYWWSPDESRIAYTRVDESRVPEKERFEIYADSVKVVRQRYPAAGDPNAVVELFVANVSASAAQSAAAQSAASQSAAPQSASAKSSPAAMRIDLGPNDDIYLARVDWYPDSRVLAVQRQSRDQKLLTLLRADARTGGTRELLTERSDTWVELHDELTFTSDRGDFLWASNRTGYRHLYAYSAEGRLLRTVTQGDWMLTADAGGPNSARAIRGIDRERGLVYFSANRESPLERHLYVTSFEKTGAPRRITRESGWHAVSMSGDASVYLDTYSDPLQPPRLTLHDARGNVRATLVANEIDAAHPYARYLPLHQPPEFGTLRAADGQTLHYSLLKPPGMEPGKRYPVIVEVYGGPGVQRVRRAWGNLFQQLLAQSGYVVFALDNRGSGLRGDAFESALHRDLGRVETEDQQAGAAFLRTLPYVDPERIGIWGWSYGGYMALNAMTRAPGSFAAGVAGAPVTDWRLYDTHYTERYMGTPAENPEGYSRSNVMTHAAALQGSLLVLHGMADDNVLFTHSTALFQTLQQLDKPFDAMPYPGGKHGLIRHADMGPHALRSIKRFFDENL